MLRAAGPIGTLEGSASRADWPFPLELAPAPRDDLNSRRVTRWLWLFLILGIAARTLRYALCFPLWEDECFLSANLLDHGYADLMGRLKYEQVCPLGFLWVQLTMVKLLGFHELSLRLFSLVTSLAGLFLFRHLAGRLLKGAPLVVSVAIFALAYPNIRYAAEAKHYGGDLFFSLVLTTLAVEWWREPERRRWLWALAAVIPLAVMTSFTAVFVGGGISLFAAWLLGTRGDRRGWLPWAAYNAALVGSFGLLFALSAASQSSVMLAYMQDGWREAFPPLTGPLKLMAWLVVTHAGDLLAYPFGGRNGGSSLTLVCVVAGLIALGRRRQVGLILLWLAPLGLNFAAAALHRYPYGESARVQLYMAPTFCMIAAVGATLIAWRFQKRGDRSRHALAPERGWLDMARGGAPITWLLAALVLLGLATVARDFYLPAKSAAVMRARDFARWFWFTAQFDGEVACLRTDFGRSFVPGNDAHGLVAMYLCNQRIYSARHARGEPPQWDRVSRSWPLRCVEYRMTGWPYDEAARDRWLADIESQYDLVGRERFPFLLGERGNRPPRDLDYLEVYKFVPKGPATAAADRGRRAAGR